jgi:hypothetical protein
MQNPFVYRPTDFTSPPAKRLFRSAVGTSIAENMRLPRGGQNTIGLWVSGWRQADGRSWPRPPRSAISPSTNCSWHTCTMPTVHNEAEEVVPFPFEDDILAMFHAGTGLLLDVMPAPLRAHEMAHARPVHAALKPGDVLVADRGFCSFAHVALLVIRSVHGVFRMHQRQIAVFTSSRPHASSKT